MIKRIFLALFILAYISYAQDIFNKKSTGEGFGISKSDAIKNAINDALKKTDDLKQARLLKFTFNFDGNFDIGYEQEIDFVSNGIFNSYEIKSLTQISSNEYHAKVEIYKKIYNEKNFDNKNSLVIINKVKNILSTKFEQELLSILLQEKKFRILDKNHLDLYNQEKDIMLKDNLSDDEIISLYAALETDFLLILSPNMEQIQEEVNMQVYKVNIDYNLIDFNTMKTKTSNTLKYTMTSTSESSKQKAFRGMATKIINELSKHSKDNIDKHKTYDENI
ncbi:hypothetical protein [Campylobacter sp. RM16704]|uniref:hypothetical protein n=1 Tax=Campylobacter sp. RM16704 TaxID=1500960 RepID=UPI00057E97A2|nr:hypothetical protein [Campylobacter sp. RM16704]AJC85648.1 hypothetical protein CAQ16704_0133 [Campylobacter sp. RM16704]